MKKYKYRVIYLNGKEETFICNSFTEAVIKAKAFAYEQGWEDTINCIIDDKGVTIENIKVRFDYNLINVQSK